MAALGVVLMLLSGVIPILSYSAPLLASFFLIPVIHELGPKGGWMAWAATSLLVLILGVDKEAAFFYIFIGCTPMVKICLDRIRTGPVRVALKVLFFAVMLGIMYGLLIFVLRMEAVAAEFAEYTWYMNAVFSVGMIVVLLFFDQIIDRMTGFYVKVLRPKLTFLK